MKSKSRKAKRVNANGRRVRYRIYAGDRVRTIRTRIVPFENPAQLIRDADNVCHEWKPIQVQLLHNSGSKKPWCEIRYGTDEHDAHVVVEIDLLPTDVPLLRGYLSTFPVLLSTCLIAEWPEEAEDDGGEELPVPSESDSLEDMSTIGGVQ